MRKCLKYPRRQRCSRGSRRYKTSKGKICCRKKSSRSNLRAKLSSFEISPFMQDFYKLKNQMSLQTNSTPSVISLPLSEDRKPIAMPIPLPPQPTVQRPFPPPSLPPRPTNILPPQSSSSSSLPQKSSGIASQPRQPLYVEGPSSIIIMRHPKTGKRITFMSDIHETFSSCQRYNKQFVMSWAQFIESMGQCAVNQGKIIDVFAEVDVVDLNTPTPVPFKQGDQGYLFGTLLYDLTNRGCFNYQSRVNKKPCLPGLRFHYSDARVIDPKFLSIRDFIDSMREITDLVLRCIKYSLGQNEPDYATMSTCFPKTDLGISQKIELDVKNFIPLVVKKQFIGSTGETVMTQIVKDLEEESTKYETFDPNDFSTAYLSVGKLLQKVQIEFDKLQSNMQALQRLGPDGMLEVFKNINHFKNLLSIIQAKVSIVMDLYVIGRVLKPYISNAIICQGMAHTFNQIPIFEKMGYVIEQESPARAASILYSIGTRRNGKLEFSILPREYHRDIKIVYISETDTHGVVLNSKFIPFSELPVMLLNQCCDVSRLVVC